MSAVEIRAEIQSYLEQVKDESFLKVVHSMLETYVQEQEDDPIIGYSVDGVPMYASVAKREFKARLDAVDRGEFITLEELKKESETWLKGKEATQ